MYKVIEELGQGCWYWSVRVVHVLANETSHHNIHRTCSNEIVVWSVCVRMLNFFFICIMLYLADLSQWFSLYIFFLPTVFARTGFWTRYPWYWGMSPWPSGINRPMKYVKFFFRYKSQSKFSCLFFFFARDGRKLGLWNMWAKCQVPVKNS